LARPAVIKLGGNSTRALAMDVQPIDPKLIRYVGDPFVTGEVDERVFERLCELTQDSTGCGSSEKVTAVASDRGGA
jgi:hypothetical protein